VQGVSFRTFAKKCADELNIKGYAENQNDNSVYIESEGKKGSVEKFIEWCKNGPSFADVKDIKIKEGDLKNYSSFEIKY